MEEKPQYQIPLDLLRDFQVQASAYKLIQEMSGPIGIQLQRSHADQPLGSARPAHTRLAEQLLEDMTLTFIELLKATGQFPPAES